MQGGIQEDGYGDKVAEALIPFQERVKHELEKSANEVDKARKAQAKVGQTYSIFFCMEIKTTKFHRLSRIGVVLVGLAN